MQRNLVRAYCVVITAVIVTMSAYALLALMLPGFTDVSSRTVNISMEFIGMITLLSFCPMILFNNSRSDHTLVFFTIVLLISVMLFLDLDHWDHLDDISPLNDGYLLSLEMCILVAVLFCFHVFSLMLNRIPLRIQDPRLLIPLLITLFAWAVSLAMFFTGFLTDPEMLENFFDDRGVMLYLVLSALLIVCSLHVNHLGDLHRKTKILLYLFSLAPGAGLLVEVLYTDIALFRVMISYAAILLFAVEFVYRSDLLLENEMQTRIRDDEALSLQLAPHFLFNSLSSIMNLPGNNERSIDALSSLGLYLRSSLDSVTLTRPIPFQIEVEQLKVLEELKVITYGDRLNVTYELLDRDFVIPSLTLRTILASYISNTLEKGQERLDVMVSSERVVGGHLVTINALGVDKDKLDNFEKDCFQTEEFAISKRVSLMCAGRVGRVVSPDGHVIISINIPGGRK
ncbi:MAG: histidine kinase [archaeon]|nr:histidine kinase [archaeon]